MDRKEHLELLCDAGEMFALLSGDSETGDILKRCVDLVAAHLDAEVCSIYLLKSGTRRLVLRATRGLRPSAVGALSLEVGQGLVGKAMETRQVVLENQASRHPDFKYFPSAGEEAFECFLAVPILRGDQEIGVMVVQRRAAHPFVEDEAMVLRSIASQLAVLVNNARVMLGISPSGPEGEQTGGEKWDVPAPPPLPEIISARPASSGVAVGRALHARKNPILEMLRGHVPLPDRSGKGTAELQTAVTDTIRLIEQLEQMVSKRLPEAVTLIFDAHIMILKDKGFSVKMVEMTRDGVPALEAVVRVARRYMDLFGSSGEQTLREKVADVEDVASRLIENLMAEDALKSGDQKEKILIARDLLPSEAVSFAMKGVAGFILIGGGVTSHAAILARSLAIPMVICEYRDILNLPGGTPLLLDARAGNIYCRPDHKILTEFRHQLSEASASQKIPDPETRTRDGEPVMLMANINLLAELEGALSLNAAGVGLYRSEFPYLVRNNLPSLGEQLRVYHILFSRMAGREVTVRTLDVGGDKLLSYFDNAGEANPELGLRSIRFSFAYPDIFRQQLLAVLEAAYTAEPRPCLRIMFPMISSLDEYRRARRMVVDAHEKVTKKMQRTSKSAHRALPELPLPEIGMMLELPSVMEVMKELVREVDFFSIGTNDFVQYMLAADRANDRVTIYYTPHHPGVLRALARIAGVVTAAGKDLSVCGEMANHPAFIPFFLGLGIRKLSVNQNYLYPVQQCVGKWRMTDAEQYVDTLLSAGSVAEVAAALAS